MAQTYIYASRMKDLAKQMEMRVSGEAMDIINGLLEEMMKKAAERAKANGRKTIQKQDF
ncbi:histone-like protein [Gemmatimonadota bacterium]